MKILVAVDGSKPSLKAVQLLIDHCDWYRSPPQVELVTVHLPVPKLPRMGIAVGKDQIERYYREEGEANLAAARKKLDAAGVPYQAHVLVGPVPVGRQLLELGPQPQRSSVGLNRPA